ncbi:NACHT domain-containing protein [Embleya sp. NBC_00896]|uniref:NACHT domain-containing protein n=1 Tax=Embleya sp. NBC_00896 TaxID=2975961 RepID=UPI002F915406|nr:NACHT domain-containing protein [Embleya sp. NBC_00896]
MDPVLVAVRVLAPAVTGGGRQLYRRLRIARGAWDAKAWDRAVRNLAADCEALRRSEFGWIDDRRWMRATEAAAEALTATGCLDARVTLRQAMDPGRLAAHVLALDERRPDRADVRDVPGAYERIVELACAELVACVRRSPEFPSAVAVEQLGRLERIEQFVTPPSDADLLDFEQRYCAGVARTLDRMELFGVTLKDPDFRYPMSTAYVSLAADEPGSTGTLGTRIEDVLAGRRRVLVRGEAGSGKTTLLHRLAVWAARDGFPTRLSDREGVVPFFLPLRHFSFAAADPGALPAPENFLDHTGSMLRAELPPGWVRDLLRTGRAMVLIDGVDEIPDAQRTRLTDWITELCAQYPRAWIVATSRPTAISSQWLATEGFVSVRLLPMEIVDQRAFVEHWYGAVRADPREGQPSHDAYKADLLGKLLTYRHLRRLAANPLLCALICTLHRERRMEVPADRIKLYQAALEMLLARRDQDRGVFTPVAAALGDRAQEAITQQFACWMVRNGHSEVPRRTAEEQIGRYLARTSRPVLAPAEALDYLLVRSGVLREPSPGYVDFVHRTFQEFFAARQLLEDGDLGLLVENADADDRWREVFTMAVGLARERERDRLIDELLCRAWSNPRKRDNLLLLAADAVDNSPTLDPKLRASVMWGSASLLPPATVEQARQLATLGEVVLDALSVPKLPIHAPTIELAAAVGGDMALEHLAGFAELTKDAFIWDADDLIRLLLGAARSFPFPAYGERVLSRCHVPEGMSVGISSMFDIEQYSYLNPVPSEVVLHTADWATGPPADFVSSLRRLVVEHVVQREPAFDFDLSHACPRLEELEIRLAVPSGAWAERLARVAGARDVAGLRGMLAETGLTLPWGRGRTLRVSLTPTEHNRRTRLYLFDWPVDADE